ncbi:MAG: M3 family oligoendopeptidase [Chloroflexota bacterium]
MSELAAELTGAEEIVWDLGDLYARTDDPAIDRDLDEADKRAEALGEGYRGRIAALDAAELLALIKEYEAVGELAGKVGTYAYLHWSTNTEDPARGALVQKVNERGAQLQQKLVFIEVEWANAPDEAAAALIDDPALAHYRHWLEMARRRRPHLLTEPEEKIMAEKAVSGRNAWTRFFDEVSGAARYELDGEMVSMEVILSRLYHPEREKRVEAAAAFTRGLESLSRTMTYIFNTLLADKASDDKLRHYATWITARNLDNEVDDQMVEALIEAVTRRYDVVARYYNLKRRLLGLDELFDYDRYAPLPAADRRYTWEQARDAVLTAYSGFHPRMGEIAGRFFEHHWIDAAVVPGKRGGAFSHSGVPSVHPYILMNYQARSRDVMTLAHELGHGIHQWLSRRQGMLMADTPLTTAETASVFGEMLVFQDLLAQETDDSVRLAMLTAKIEESFATVFRQISMNRFENAIHTARRAEGELTTERFGELWYETQVDMFRGSVTITDDYRWWWSYIPHFVHVPGYVYAYGFGELLVLALYARYQADGEGFADAYLDMLTAGGSDWPHKIVRPLGVDLTDPDFWNNGLQILDDMVSEAEALAGGDA